MDYYILIMLIEKEKKESKNEKYIWYLDKLVNFLDNSKKSQKIENPIFFEKDIYSFHFRSLHIWKTNILKEFSIEYYEQEIRRCNHLLEIDSIKYQEYKNIKIKYQEKIDTLKKMSEKDRIDIIGNKQLELEQEVQEYYNLIIKKFKEKSNQISIKNEFKNTEEITIENIRDRIENELKLEENQKLANIILDYIDCTRKEIIKELRKD